MLLASMNRSSASGPPRSGSGARRAAGAASSPRIAAAVAVLIRSGITVAASDVGGSIESNRIARERPAMIARAMVDPTLAKRLLAGDRRALARAISLVENDRPEGWELVKEIYPHTGNASIVGFTGP